MKRGLIISAIALGLWTLALWTCHPAPGNLFVTPFGPPTWIYVDATNGSGAGQRGNPGMPFKNIVSAVAASREGDIVFVNPGLYVDNALTNKANMTFYFCSGATVSNGPLSIAVFSGTQNRLIVRGFGSFTNGQFFTTTASGDSGSFDVECDSMINNSAGSSLFNAFSGQSRLKARRIANTFTANWVFEHPGITAKVSCYDTVFEVCDLCDLGQVNLFNCTLTNNTQNQNFGGALTMFGGFFSGDWTVNPNTGSITFWGTMVDAAGSIPSSGTSVYGAYSIGDFTSIQGGFTNLIDNVNGIRTLGPTPTVVTNNGLNVGATLTTAGNDSLLSVTVNTGGTTTASATNLTVTFKAAKKNVPHIFVTAENANAAGRFATSYATNITTTGFNIVSGTTAWQVSSTLIWAYLIVE